ncbi:hypothetical protein QQX98_012110 [Neonectria punicea]|uniref:Uncharacterized protein n=1 Tax=Neonectria punicea TaxID=979145 RepID=A0ABR1GJR4_9HYPO
MTYLRSRSVISEKSDVSFSQDDGDSVFDVDEDQSPDDITEPSDISDTDSSTDSDDDSGLHRGNVHPPEYFLRMQEDFNEEKKEFRLVYERETRRKIDPILNRKMKKILRQLLEKHGLTGERRENRRMTVEDLKRQAETAISTTKMRFRIGEHRIAALLFYQLLAPTGARPKSLLYLRYGDIMVSLARDPEGGPHLVLIRFLLHFIKTYLGAKETTTSTLPEYFFDLSLLLNSYVLLLGLLFRYKAFKAPSLTSPKYMDRLDIHPGEYELPLPLKESLSNIFVFRDTIKTAFNSYEISANKRLTYGVISRWTRKIGELAGFAMAVILYSLRYNAANEFDQCPDVSDGLRNLILQHKNSDPFRQNYLERVVSVDTSAIVRHTRQQKALMRQACSIGYSVSKRRPTDLTPEQAASVDKDPRI